ncbi:MAG: hypothetical protein MK207_11360 [Saprospiraceae bacterium]|nr:hypothetical protein [Saprospiraceae bacterium]
MKLVADSGGTKTDWYLVKGKNFTIYTTQGYNPYFCDSLGIQESIEHELLNNLDVQDVKEVYFYGAGCASNESKQIIISVLSAIFSKSIINVGDDILAASRATAGHNPGICCILGTGSSSCFYDGKIMVDRIPSLGFILGDEGSGADIGKKLIRSFFYRDIPDSLSVALEGFYDMDKHMIVTNLISGKYPNRFLASFATFCSEHLEHPFIQKLVADSFDTFLDHHVLKYKNSGELPVHFVGSVAYSFKTLLLASLKRKKLLAGKILKSPFPALLEF